MSEATPSSNKTLLWVGRVLSALPVLALVMSGLMKVTSQPPVMEQLGKAGYTAGAITAIGVVELLSVALYAAPPTSVLGAILVTGYLGGAINTHVRAGEGFAPALILGILAWAGLFLRDARLRELLPLRKAALAPASPPRSGAAHPGGRAIFRHGRGVGVGAGVGVGVGVGAGLPPSGAPPSGTSGDPELATVAVDGVVTVGAGMERHGMGWLTVADGGVGSVAVCAPGSLLPQAATPMATPDIAATTNRRRLARMASRSSLGLSPP